MYLLGYLQNEQKFDVNYITKSIRQETIPFN